MRPSVSPSASRFIARTSPFSGRVMLSPIMKLKPRPSTTMSTPMARMPVRVRACAAASRAEARLAVSRARVMMSSACGSMLWLSMSITARSGCTWSKPLTHCAKV